MNDIIPAGEPEPRNLPAAITPMQMLNMAVEKGASIEQLDKLMTLQERWEKNEAKKAFVEAMNAFKEDPPLILKNRKVDYTTAKGRTTYMHAVSGEASEKIGLALSMRGISHAWKTEQKDGVIRVTCTLTHKLGHSESTTLEARADESGGKNAVQAIGSAVSYLQRYTLFAACGLVPKDADNDGQGAQQSRTMDENEKFDWLTKIEDLQDLKAADSLWAIISPAVRATGDFDAYDELKAAMGKKRRSFQ